VDLRVGTPGREENGAKEGGKGEWGSKGGEGEEREGEG